MDPVADKDLLYLAAEGLKALRYCIGESKQNSRSRREDSPLSRPSAIYGLTLLIGCHAKSGAHKLIIFRMAGAGWCFTSLAALTLVPITCL
eukprot:1216024-Amphidinium_carterae.2